MYYVSYVDKQGQLVVDFYNTVAEYDEAKADAEARYDSWEYGTYIYGEVP